jgi:hypothetical protein
VYHLYIITQHALPIETIPLFCYNYNAETVLDEELQASSDDELFQIGLQSGHRPGGKEELEVFVFVLLLYIKWMFVLVVLELTLP